MKIGFVIDDTLDSTDGVQQYVLLVGEWLKTKGHKVHYIAGQTTRKDLGDTHSLSKNFRVRFNKNVLSIPLPASRKAIKNVLEENEFDVLHVQMPYSPQLAGRIIKAVDSKIGIVATFHIAPHTKLVAFANKILGRAQQSSIQRLDKIISVSQTAQEFALDAFGIKSNVIPNSIDTKLWKPPQSNVKKDTIVFVGRLVERKGAQYLLQAFARLQAEYPSDTKLIIAGTGPLEEKLKNYVSDNKLRSKVEFMGYVTEADKRKLLQEARVAVFPATGGESFGIVLLEAMAAGTVTLGGDNPGYSGVLSETPEALFRPKDIDNFKATIHRALAEQNFYENLRRKQAKIIKGYDIQNVGSAILEEYNQAIKQRKTNAKPR